MPKYSLPAMKQALYRCPNRDCKRCPLFFDLSDDGDCKLLYVVSDFIDQLQVENDMLRERLDKE